VSLRFNQSNSWIVTSENGSYFASRTGKDWYLEGSTEITTLDSAFDGLYAYAVGEFEGSGIVLQSRDGCTWKKIPIDSSVEKVTQVISVKSLGFVAMVGKASDKTYIGAIGQNFNLSEAFIDGSYFSSLIFDGVRLVAAGKDGIIASRDYPCPAAVTTLKKVNNTNRGIDKIVHAGSFYLLLQGGTVVRIESLESKFGQFSLNSVFDIEWNGAVFVAAGKGTLSTSCDGGVWQHAQSIEVLEKADALDVLKVAWNGLQWIAIAKLKKSGSEKNILLASEGDQIPKCWQRVELEDDLESPTSITPLSYGAITMPVYSTWIGCFANGLQRSSRGKEWTPCFFASGGKIESEKKGAAFGDNKWVAVGNKGGSGDSTILFSDSTATKWYPALSGAFSEQGCDVVAGKNIWVAVGKDPNCTIKYSHDGREWKNASNAFNIRGNKVAYSQGYFVAAGKDTNKMANIKISKDGRNWQNAGIKELEEALAVESTPIGPESDQWFVGGIPLDSSSSALVVGISDSFKGNNNKFSASPTQFKEIRAMKFNGCALVLVGDGEGFNVELRFSDTSTKVKVETSGSLTDVSWNGIRWLFGDNQGHIWQGSRRDGGNVSKADVSADIGAVNSFATNCSILGRVRFVLPIDFRGDKGDVVPLVFDTTDEHIQELAVTLSGVNKCNSTNSTNNVSMGNIEGTLQPMPDWWTP
jgi:hypothetical protein